MSTPDLHTRAARFFLLAGQASRLNWWSFTIFWKMFASPAVEATAHLPAMAAAVRKPYNTGFLWEFSSHPLPGVLLPEDVPWFDNLVEDLEVQRDSNDSRIQSAVRRALVQLEGCGMPDGMERPSRLPEWLAEARRMVEANSELARTGELRVASSKWQMEDLETLAALAAWRPARGVITPPETLREWVAFWQEIRRSKDPLLKGIASRALLNLPKADLRAASLRPYGRVPYGRVPTPPLLLRDLAAAIPAAAERTARTGYDRHLLMLDWQPGENSPLPAAGVAEVARTWLKITLHHNNFCCRAAWRQLIRWDQAGSLATCGMDLLPLMVRAAQTEKDNDVLWEMAQWKPAAEAFTGTEKPDRPALLRELEAHWQRHRQSGDWRGRASAWLAGIRLHQAGLATESPESFQETYLSAVAREGDEDVLLVLAQWSPGAAAPAALHREWHKGWEDRLEDQNESIRQVAAVALLRQALGNGTGERLRRMALDGWRTGTNEGQAARQMLDTVLFRFHEVRAELAAGRVPDFEEEPAPPAQRQYPCLVLPPGHITDREWRIENEKLKMENHEGALGPANRSAPDGPSR